jgi:hypothetical protein
MFLTFCLIDNTHCELPNSDTNAGSLEVKFRKWCSDWLNDNVRLFRSLCMSVYPSFLELVMKNLRECSCQHQCTAYAQLALRRCRRTNLSPTVSLLGGHAQITS